MKKLGYIAATVAIAAVAITATMVPAQADECVIRRSVVRTSSSLGPGVMEYSYSEPSYVVERRVNLEEPQIIRRSVVVEQRPSLVIEKPAILTAPVMVERPSVVRSSVVLERPTVLSSPVILQRPSVVTSSVVVDPPVVMERRLPVVRSERIIEKRDSHHLIDAKIPFARLKMF